MNAHQRELVQAARERLERAYAPYSRFSVAAALRGVDASIHCGVNVENVSLGLSLCAERGAVAAAIAAGVRHFTDIAIVSSAASATPPCGACRQVLHEFAPQLRVWLPSADGHFENYVLLDLLPVAFASFDPA